MRNKRVFVTGGAGFIGSEVVRQLLSKGYLVTVYDNLTTGTPKNLPKDRAVRLISGDITSFEKVRSAIKGNDYVIHLAAQAFIPLCYHMPMGVAKTNALGSLNVFRACLNNGVKRIVHVSSSEVYGSAVRVPMDEQHPLNPRSTYAVSKLAADLWAKTMAFEHKLPVVIIRPFNVFGPRDTYPRFIPEVVRQCFKAPVVRVGNLDVSRDFTYVEDTARGMILALETDEAQGEVINLGTGKSQKMSEVLRMIKVITGKERKEVRQDAKLFRPWDVDKLLASFRKASKILGWKPQVGFREGLQKTIEWYARNGEAWPYERREGKRWF